MQLDLLRKNARTINFSGQSANLLNTELILFPSMNFTCNGRLTGLLLAADIRWRTVSRDRYPEIQIWRNVGSDCYLRQASQEIRLNPGVFSPDGMLQYNLSPPMLFQSGDVLGVYHPPEHESALRLYYTNSNNAPDSYRLITSFVSTTTVLLRNLFRRSNQLLLLSPITGKLN